jgi:hypothetical protein
MNRIEISDIHGKKVLSSVINNGESGIGFTISHLPTGVYSVSAFNKSQMRANCKLIIVR